MILLIKEMKKKLDSRPLTDLVNLARSFKSLKISS